MNIIDFLIGATLMNAMPHYVLGVWKGRMLSAFGFGDIKNMLYGVLCFALSLGLYFYKYGLGHLFNDGMYAGAMFILVIYFLTGRLWYVLFHVRSTPQNMHA